MSKILAISLLLRLRNLQVQILSFIFLTDSVSVYYSYLGSPDSCLL